MKYRVHKLSIKMTEDQARLEEYLNSLKGEIVSIVPNISVGFFGVPVVNFLLIVEKVH
jgi:hypothetical protein